MKGDGDGENIDFGKSMQGKIQGRVDMLLPSGKIAKEIVEHPGGKP